MKFLGDSIEPTGYGGYVTHLANPFIFNRPGTYRAALLMID